MLARVLIVVALVAGIARVPGTLDVVRDDAARGRSMRVVDGVTHLTSAPDGTEELIALVRRVVPEHDAIRIVSNGGVCRRFAVRDGFGYVFWLQYHFLPRPARCEPSTRWWVYARLAPAGPDAPPPGSAISYVRPTLALVRLPDQGR